jgi:hypothetical protein
MLPAFGRAAPELAEARRARRPGWRRALSVSLDELAGHSPPAEGLGAKKSKGERTHD